MGQFLVLVYDISNDRRRTKLHNKLLDFGSPVQYSVFEFILSNKELEQLKKTVNKVIHPKVDHVRYYYLCADCLAKTEITSGKDLLKTKPDSIII